MKKEKIFRILTLIFTVLTFIGAGYVFINKGEKNVLCKIKTRAIHKRTY